MSDGSLPQLDWRVVFNRATPPGRKGWGRVRAAQMTEMSRAMTIAAWGQAINAILLVLILINSVPGHWLSLWLLAIAALMLIAFSHLQQTRGRIIHSISRRAIERASYHSLFFGAVWSVPPAFFFKFTNSNQELAIAVVTASMMSGAAFIFGTVPPAARAYILVLGLAATSMLWRGGPPLIAAIGPIYTTGLLLMIFSNGRAFMQRKCVELALEERTETVSLLLREYESSDADWLWQTNRNLGFQNVSARFARAVRYNVDALEGTSIFDLLSRSQITNPGASQTLQALTETIRKRAPFAEVLVPIETSDGARCIELSARPRFNGQGGFLGYRGVGSDVTDARQAADRISHMARHDALTGLPNRLSLLDALETALTSARDEGSECAVLLIDLDRFKSVNDSLGHVAGDHLLQQVSARFDRIIEADMTPGRLGGDEFAIVIPNFTGAGDIERLCSRIIRELKEPFIYNDQHLFVGASIGVAVGPTDADSVEELVRNADLALYRAKAEGGDDICFYEPGLHANAEERRQLEVAMRSALERGEFHLVYQPVFNARTSKIESFEALLRWNNEELGAIGPQKFIPIAEETGLIGPIGEWVLRTACFEAATWPSDVGIAVNISPRQLQEPSFMLTLISALSQSGIEAHRLELEVTESVFLDVTPQTKKVLHQIQILGIRLAMDDFGTGYSSLGYLRETNFNTLKIDRSFVSAISRDDPESSAIVRAVVALSESLSMTSVAEGVETAEQLALVRELGCDRIQGFILSKPLPASAIKPLFADGKARRAA